MCQREQRIGPDTMGVDWVTRSNGHRLYVCPRHARDLGRFGRALEEVPDTPEADVCTACGKLTLKDDMTNPRVCAGCAEEDLGTQVLANAGREALTFEEATDLLADLVDEDEDVPPEKAAEAVERWSGMPMTPATEDPASEEDTAEEE